MPRQLTPREELYRRWLEEQEEQEEKKAAQGQAATEALDLAGPPDDLGLYWAPEAGGTPPLDLEPPAPLAPPPVMGAPVAEEAPDEDWFAPPSRAPQIQRPPEADQPDLDTLDRIRTKGIGLAGRALGGPPPMPGRALEERYASIPQPPEELDWRSDPAAPPVPYDPRYLQDLPPTYGRQHPSMYPEPPPEPTEEELRRSELLDAARTSLEGGRTVGERAGARRRLMPEVPMPMTAMEERGFMAPGPLPELGEGAWAAPEIAAAEGPAGPMIPPRPPDIFELERQYGELTPGRRVATAATQFAGGFQAIPVSVAKSIVRVTGRLSGQDASDVENSAVMRELKAMEETIKTSAAEVSHPAAEKEFLAGKLAHGLGTSVGFIGMGNLLSIPGFPAKIARIQSYVTIGSLGSGAGFDELYEDAKRNGASDDDAWAAGLLGGLVGISECAPLGRMLNRLNRAGGGSLRQTIRDAGIEGIEEWAQEFFQTTAGNSIAREWVGYAPDREILEGAMEAGAVGGASGILMSIMTSILSAGRASVGGGGGRADILGGAVDVEGGPTIVEEPEHDPKVEAAFRKALPPQVQKMWDATSPKLRKRVIDSGISVEAFLEDLIIDEEAKAGVPAVGFEAAKLPQELSREERDAEVAKVRANVREHGRLKEGDLLHGTDWSFAGLLGILSSRTLRTPHVAVLTKQDLGDLDLALRHAGVGRAEAIEGEPTTYRYPALFRVNRDALTQEVPGTQEGRGQGGEALTVFDEDIPTTALEVWIDSQRRWVPAVDLHMGFMELDRSHFGSYLEQGGEIAEHVETTLEEVGRELGHLPAVPGAHAPPAGPGPGGPPGGVPSAGPGAVRAPEGGRGPGEAEGPGAAQGPPGVQEGAGERTQERVALFVRGLESAAPELIPRFLRLSPEVQARVATDPAARTAFLRAAARELAQEAREAPVTAPPTEPVAPPPTERVAPPPPAPPKPRLGAYPERLRNIERDVSKRDFTLAEKSNQIHVPEELRQEVAEVYDYEVVDRYMLETAVLREIMEGGGISSDSLSVDERAELTGFGGKSIQIVDPTNNAPGLDEWPSNLAERGVWSPANLGKVGEGDLIRHLMGTPPATERASLFLEAAQLVLDRHGLPHSRAEQEAEARKSEKRAEAAFGETPEDIAYREKVIQWEKALREVDPSLELKEAGELKEGEKVRAALPPGPEGEPADRMVDNYNVTQTDEGEVVFKDGGPARVLADAQEVLVKPGAPEEGGLTRMRRRREEEPTRPPAPPAEEAPAAPPPAEAVTRPPAASPAEAPSAPPAPAAEKPAVKEEGAFKKTDFEAALRRIRQRQAEEEKGSLGEGEAGSPMPGAIVGFDAKEMADMLSVGGYLYQQGARTREEWRRQYLEAVGRAGKPYESLVWKAIEAHPALKALPEIEAAPPTAKPPEAGPEAVPTVPLEREEEAEHGPPTEEEARPPAAPRPTGERKPARGPRPGPAVERGRLPAGRTPLALPSGAPRGVARAGPGVRTASAEHLPQIRLDQSYWTEAHNVDLYNEGGKVVLAGHQQEDVVRALMAAEKGRGFVNADDTGTGKTYSSCATCWRLRQDVPDLRSVLICPNKDIALQWAKVLGQMGISIEKLDPGRRRAAEGDNQPVYWMTYNKMLDYWREFQGQQATGFRTFSSYLTGIEGETGGIDLAMFDEPHTKMKYHIKEKETAIAGVGLGSEAGFNLYTTATPVASMLHTGYLSPLGLWTDATDLMRRYNVSFDEEEKVWHGLTPQKLRDLNEEMIRKGVMISHEMRFDGITGPDGKPVHLTADMLFVRPSEGAAGEFAKLHQVIADYLLLVAKQGKKKKPPAGLTRVINGRRAQLSRLMMELAKIQEAARLVRKAVSNGKQVGMFTLWRESPKLRATGKMKAWLNPLYDKLAEAGLYFPSPIDAAEAALSGYRMRRETRMPAPGEEGVSQVRFVIEKAKDIYQAPERGPATILGEWETAEDGRWVEMGLESSVEKRANERLTNLRSEAASKPGGIRIVQVTGRQAAGTRIRQDNLNAFQHGEADVLLATIGAGATGLDLHHKFEDGRPREQIILSTPWTAPEFKQVAGRMFRMGSRSSATQRWLFVWTDTDLRYSDRVAERIREMGGILKGETENPTADDMQDFNFPDSEVAPGGTKPEDFLEDTISVVVTGGKHKGKKGVLLPKKVAGAGREALERILLDDGTTITVRARQIEVTARKRGVEAERRPEAGEQGTPEPSTPTTRMLWEEAGSKGTIEEFTREQLWRMDLEPEGLSDEQLLEVAEQPAIDIKLPEERKAAAGEPAEGRGLPPYRVQHHKGRGWFVERLVDGQYVEHGTALKTRKAAQKELDLLLAQPELPGTEAATREERKGPAEEGRDEHFALDGGRVTDDERQDSLFSPAAPQRANPFAPGYSPGEKPAGHTNPVVQVDSAARRPMSREARHDIPVVSKKKIVRALANLGNMISPFDIRSGGIRARSFRGIYKIREQIARLKKPYTASVETTAHELGHHFDKVLFGGGKHASEVSNRFSREMVTLGKALYGPKKPKVGGYRSEGMAELFRLYITDAERAQAAAPDTYEFVDNWLLENTPELHRGLLKVRGLFELYATAGPVARTLAQIAKKRTRRGGSLPDLMLLYKDMMWPLRRMELEMLKAGVPEGLFLEAFKGPRAIESPYLRSRIMPGMVQDTAKTWLEMGAVDPDTGHPIQGTRGFYEILRPFEDSGRYEALEHYLTMLRADQLHERGIHSGFDRADVKAVLEQYGAREDFADFEAAAKDIRLLNDALLDYAVARGLLSKKMAKLWREKNLDYLPWLRDLDDDATFGSPLESGGGKPASFKRMRGDENPIVQPLAAWAQNLFNVLQAAEWNGVKLAAVDLAAKVEGGGYWLEKVQPPLKPIKVTAEEVARRLKQLGLDVDSIPDDIIEELGLTIWRPDWSKTGRMTTKVYRNGKPELYYVKDASLFRTISQADKATVRMLMWATGPIRKTSNLLRRGAVLNIDFMMGNVPRDQVIRAVQGEAEKFPMVDIPKMLCEVIGRGDAYESWRRAGARMSQPLELQRLDKAEKALRDAARSGGIFGIATHVVRHPIGAIGLAAGISDEITRVGAWKGSLRAAKKGGEEGRSAEMRAGLITRDATLDFDRMGVYGRVLNASLPFWNVSIEGPLLILQKIKAHPVRTLRRIFMYVTLPDILLAMVHWDDEDWTGPRGPAEWEKDVYWWFKIGGEWWGIPKPPLIGPLFGTIPGRLTEDFMKWCHDEEPEAYKEIKGTLTRGMGISLLPTALLYSLEAFSNWSIYFDRPIVGPNKQELLPRFQEYYFTSDLAHEIGTRCGIAPAMIDHAVVVLSGGLGRDVRDIISAGGRISGLFEERPRARSKVWDYPPFRKFHSRTPHGQTRPRKEFYKLLAESMQCFKTKNDMIKRGREPAEVLAKLTHEELVKGQAAPSLLNYATSFSQLGRVRDNLMENRKLHKSERKKLREIVISDSYLTDTEARGLLLSLDTGEVALEDRWLLHEVIAQRIHNRCEVALREVEAAQKEYEKRAKAFRKKYSEEGSKKK